MQSIEKMFALVDRKIDNFDFSIKKVKGNLTGNEYYAVCTNCIVNEEEFVKRILTIGCPGKAINTTIKAILDKSKEESTMKNSNFLRREMSVTLNLHNESSNGITLKKMETTETGTFRTEEEYEDDDMDFGIDCDEAPQSDSGIKLCPYCNAPVASNFAYCPRCGGIQ